MDDNSHLRQFVEAGSQESFRELVGRHTNLVYACAMQRLRDPHAAEDVTQAVFLTLALKAKNLRSHTSLAGWLFTTTRYVATRYQRGEQRRKEREMRAFEETQIADSGTATEAAWEHMQPHLAGALDSLSGTDREAVLLRFYRKASHQEVATALGTSEDGARKRVDRALNKLRRFITNKGVALSASALAGALTANAAPAAPAGLAATAGTTALAGVGGTLTATSTLVLAKGAMNMLFWNSVKTAAVAVAAVVVAGSGMVVAQQVERTRTSERALAVAGQSVAETVEPSDAVVLQMRGDVEELIRRSDHVVVCETLAADHEKQTATVTVVRALKGDATGSLAVSWNPKRVKSESSHPGLLPESGRIAVAALSRAKSSSVSQTNAVYELVLDTLLANRLASPTDAPVALFDTYCRLVNLGDPATPAVAAKRLDLLRTQIQGDRWTYRWAAMRIARHQVPTADRRDFVPLLLRTLQDRVSKVLVETMWVCADWKVTEATEPILAILNAQKRADAEVVETGLRMVGQLNSDKAFETLVRFAGDDNATLRESAVFGLLFGRDRKKVDPLLKAMRDTDGRVRARACEAFGNVREKRLVPVLIEALADPECNQQAIRILKSWTGQDLGFNPFDPLNFGPQVAKWRKWWSENEATFEFNDATVTPAAQR